MIAIYMYCFLLFLLVKYVQVEFFKIKAYMYVRHVLLMYVANKLYTFNYFLFIYFWYNEIWELCTLDKWALEVPTYVWYLLQCSLLGKWSILALATLTSQVANASDSHLTSGHCRRCSLVTCAMLVMLPW